MRHNFVIKGSLTERGKASIELNKIAQERPEEEKHAFSITEHSRLMPVNGDKKENSIC